MAQGCMACKGAGNLCFIEWNMTSQTYVNELRENLLNSATKLGIRNSYHF